MGGPAMIEGGGLGVFAARRGRADRRAGRQRRRRPARRRRRARRSRAAKRYLSYFRGPASARRAAPTRRALRDLIPEQPQARLRRARGASTRCSTRARCSSCAAASAPGMVTALARVDGRPLGVIANDPTHLGGAIDADGADKAARFLQLCDAFELPVAVPVRHARLHGRPRRPSGPRPCATSRACSSTGANLTRADRHDRAAQGLRARRAGDGRRRLQGAAVHASRWPTVEFGGDGPRGRGAAGHAPRARGDRGPGGARARLRARRSPPPTSAAAALNMAAYGEIDDVIDPADIAPLDRDAVRRVQRRWWDTPGKRRPNVDTW